MNVISVLWSLFLFGCFGFGTMSAESDTTSIEAMKLKVNYVKTKKSMTNAKQLKKSEVQNQVQGSFVTSCSQNQTQDVTTTQNSNDKSNIATFKNTNDKSMSETESTSNYSKTKSSYISNSNSQSKFVNETNVKTNINTIVKSKSLTPTNSNSNSKSKLLSFCSNVNPPLREPTIQSEFELGRSTTMNINQNMKDQKQKERKKLQLQQQTKTNISGMPPEPVVQTLQKQLAEFRELFIDVGDNDGDGVDQHIQNNSKMQDNMDFRQIYENVEKKAATIAFQNLYQQTENIDRFIKQLIHSLDKNVLIGDIAKLTEKLSNATALLTVKQAELVMERQKVVDVQELGTQLNEELAIWHKKSHEFIVRTDNLKLRNKEVILLKKQVAELGGLNSRQSKQLVKQKEMLKEKGRRLKSQEKGEKQRIQKLAAQLVEQRSRADLVLGQKTQLMEQQLKKTQGLLKKLALKTEEANSYKLENQEMQKQAILVSMNSKSNYKVLDSNSEDLQRLYSACGVSQISEVLDQYVGQKQKIMLLKEQQVNQLKRIQALVKQNKKHQSDLKTQIDENKTLAQDVAILKSSLQSAQSENNDLKAQAAESKNSIIKLNNELSKLKQEKKPLSKSTVSPYAYANLQKKVKDLNSQLKVLRGDNLNFTLATDKLSFQKQLKVKKRIRNNNNQRNYQNASSNSSRNRKLEKVNQRLQNDLQTQQNENQRLQSDYDNLQNYDYQLQDDYQQLQGDYQQLQDDYQWLQDDYQCTHDKVSQELSTAKTQYTYFQNWLKEIAIANAYDFGSGNGEGIDKDMAIQVDQSMLVGEKEIDLGNDKGYDEFKQGQLQKMKWWAYSRNSCLPKGKLKLSSLLVKKDDKSQWINNSQEDLLKVKEKEHKKDQAQEEKEDLSPKGQFKPDQLISSAMRKLRNKKNCTWQQQNQGINFDISQSNFNQFPQEMQQLQSQSYNNGQDASNNCIFNLNGYPNPSQYQHQFQQNQNQVAQQQQHQNFSNGEQWQQDYWNNYL